MNLAYHHIRGWIMVVGPRLARLYCTTNTDISTSWRGVFNKQTMSIVRPSWAGWDWHCVNNQTETDPKSPEEQTAGAGWVWAWFSWFSWCSDITGCCFNTILVSHQPGLLPVCSLSNYRHHNSHSWPWSDLVTSCLSLHSHCSPPLDWAELR